MKIHRFFYDQKPLEHQFWMDDKNLFHQWINVLRLQVGEQVNLFDGEREDRLYKIVQIGTDAVKLELITELERQIPEQDIYLFFSLLKKDKNDWVLQKCTELGVGHFVPILSDRTEKTGFNTERARKIVIEASEQCGRSDIPNVREPIRLTTALEQFENKIKLYYAEQGDNTPVQGDSLESEAAGIFIGPEGGWTDSEKDLLEQKCVRLNLSQFTLRAETACITAAHYLAK